jgi:hypothetical protein
MTARSAAVAEAGAAAGGAATSTEGSAGVVEGVEGATHRTAAHKPATAAPATKRRRQAATSNIAQLVNMPTFRVDTSWRSIPT